MGWVGGSRHEYETPRVVPRAETSPPAVCLGAPSAGCCQPVRPGRVRGGGRAPARCLPPKRAPLVSRLAGRRVQALRARGPIGRHRRLLPTQLDQVEHALLEGAGAHGFVSNLWTLERVAEVIWRLTGVRHHPVQVWRILTGRLGWSLQRPRRSAAERDQAAVNRWLAEEWPRIKRGRAAGTPGWSSWTRAASRAAPVVRARPEPGGDAVDQPQGPGAGQPGHRQSR